MEPITTALITSFVISLGKKGLESAFENVGEKISDKAMEWIKGLLFKGGTPKNALKELQDNPGNEIKQFHNSCFTVCCHINSSVLQHRLLSWPSSFPH